MRHREEQNKKESKTNTKDCSQIGYQGWTVSGLSEGAIERWLRTVCSRKRRVERLATACSYQGSRIAPCGLNSFTILDCSCMLAKQIAQGFHLTASQQLQA